MKFDINEHPHRRWNPLTCTWVLVSPHRAKRPWQGQVEKIISEKRPEHDHACYLCPGNQRANGVYNPMYQHTYAFENDFAALLPYAAMKNPRQEALFKIQPEHGICKVICFSPRHDLSIPEMELADIKKVIDLWCEEYHILSQLNYIRHIQIFENKGSIMGCSNPHPHGQIWAQTHIPEEPLKKGKYQGQYFKKHQRTLLTDYLNAELRHKERILFENDHFVGLVPFWAIWPFEAMLIPKRNRARITELSEVERMAYAEAYQQLTRLYDCLFECSFPYSSGIHQAPSDGKAHPEWHFHQVFYPPLLRSASVKKFMVGYELLANPQRDITPEKAAAILRSRASKKSD